MKKLVAENLEEAWVSTDTGAELYADNYGNNYRGEAQEMPADMNISDEQIESIIPPPAIRFNSSDFAEFVEQLIQALDQDPVIASRVFQKTLEKHPYLSKKAIGFHSQNPYQESIQKFIEALNRI